MKSTLAAFLVALAALVLVVGCGDDVASKASGTSPANGTASDAGEKIAPQEEGARRVGLGQVMTDFVFTDIDGRTHRLSEYASGRPLVVFMRDTTCPVCRKQGPAIRRLEESLDGRAGTLYVAPISSDDAAALAAEKKALGLTGAYVRDAGQRIARRFAASTTAEAFLLDADRRMVFRGALDDQYGLNYTKESPTRSYLADALRELENGTPITVPATTAPGCMLDIAAESVDKGPTFHRDVSPVLQRTCQRCHRPGGNAPYALETYEDVKARRAMIKYVLRKGFMPPWHAAPDVGGPWSNDMRMHDADRELMQSWIAAGCPEGNPLDAPAPRVWPQGWSIGEPDVILKTKPMKIPAEGIIDYFHELVPTGFAEDRWIRRMELRSGAPESLHHILIFENTEERRDWNINLFGRLALEEFFMIWAPGADPLVYPDDRAKVLKKGMGLIFQIHYTAVGKPLEDVVELGIVFADEPPEYPVLCDAASSAAINIGPGESGVKVPAFHELDSDGLILGFVPHMHLRGSAFEMSLIYPDGRHQDVLSVPRFDFNWQQAYRLVEPIRVPKGTVVRAVGTFDNDDATNPGLTPAQSLQRVVFGPLTDDEMMIGYFEWVRLP